VDFENILEIEFCWRPIFEMKSSINLPWGHVIGSAVLTFIEYKQTDRQDKVYA